VPATLDVSALLPPRGVPDPEIAAALADRPRRVDAPATCALRPTPEGAALTGRMAVPPMGGAETVVFELSEPGLWVTDARVRREGGTITATSELMKGGGGPVALDRSAVRITVIGQRGAVQIDGCRG
jgi:hypothetical protein